MIPEKRSHDNHPFSMPHPTSSSFSQRLTIDIGLESPQGSLALILILFQTTKITKITKITKKSPSTLSGESKYLVFDNSLVRKNRCCQCNYRNRGDDCIVSDFVRASYFQHSGACHKDCSGMAQQSVASGWMNLTEQD
jgi:hypothetical protein